jgi:hypothetical protein
LGKEKKMSLPPLMEEGEKSRRTSRGRGGGGDDNVLPEVLPLSAGRARPMRTCCVRCVTQAMALTIITVVVVAMLGSFAAIAASRQRGSSFDLAAAAADAQTAVRTIRVAESEPGEGPGGGNHGDGNSDGGTAAAAAAAATATATEAASENKFNGAGLRPGPLLALSAPGRFLSTLRDRAAVAVAEAGSNATRAPESLAARLGGFAPPGATGDQLLWFVQLTDVHIDVRVPQRARDFEAFAANDVPLIDPCLVLVTGDLTESVGTGWRAPGTVEEEWVRYGAILNKTRVRDGTFGSRRWRDAVVESSPQIAVTALGNSSAETNVTVTGNGSVATDASGTRVRAAAPFWIDIRGNHDVFNVPFRGHSRDHYSRQAALAGTMRGAGGDPDNGTDHLSIRYVARNQSVAFFVADLTPPAGFSLTVFAEFRAASRRALDAHLARHKSEQQFILGHYPDSNIARARHGAAESFSASVPRGAGVLAYLTGHSHLPRMESRRASGLLELELRDFRKHRAYRIVALDHGLFSHADLVIGEWPAIVVLNPKPARTLDPTAEPAWNIAQSTHVRVLAFAPTGIATVSVAINGKPLCENMISVASLAVGTVNGTSNGGCILCFFCCKKKKKKKKNPMMMKRIQKKKKKFQPPVCRCPGRVAGPRSLCARGAICRRRFLPGGPTRSP